MTAEGDVTIGKCAGTGGRIDAATCTEQLLYEVEDPAGYVTPDCVLNMTGIAFREVGPDRVAVSGARARSRTATYKVSVGYFDGYLGEGQLSYGGPNAVARARLAGEIVAERLRLRGFAYDALDTRLIGLDSLHGPGAGRPEPYEVRLRVTGRTQDKKAAEAVGFEVAALYTNGPAGGAGDAASVRESSRCSRCCCRVPWCTHASRWWTPDDADGARSGARPRRRQGRSVNISVIAYDEAGYERLLRELTEVRVAAAFAALADGPVRRYALPGLGAFNFVIERVQGGGVTATGALDIHGKSLSSLMLTIPLPGNEPEG